VEKAGSSAGSLDVESSQQRKPVRPVSWGRGMTEALPEVDRGVSRRRRGEES
jgi:hypothetical protein